MTVTELPYFISTSPNGRKPHVIHKLRYVRGHWRPWANGMCGTSIIKYKLLSEDELKSATEPHCRACFK